jgi:hypothetical protein
MYFMSKTRARLRIAAISRANNIVRSNLANLFPDAPYDIYFTNKPSGASFSAVDPVTGAAVNGTYLLDRRNIVTWYNADYRFAQGFISTTVGLDGTSKALDAHTYSMKTVFGMPEFADLFADTLLGDGQRFTDLIDALPGANPVSPTSTHVRIANGQYWLA